MWFNNSLNRSSNPNVSPSLFIVRFQTMLSDKDEGVPPKMADASSVKLGRFLSNSEPSTSTLNGKGLERDIAVRVLEAGVYARTSKFRSTRTEAAFSRRNLTYGF